MMEALASKSEGKLISIMKSIKYDDSAIPAGDTDPEYRIHLLMKFPKQTKVLEVPAVSSFDSNAFATWFTANASKIFDEHGDNPTALITPTPKPERKPRGR